MFAIATSINRRIYIPHEVNKAADVPNSSFFNIQNNPHIWSRKRGHVFTVTVAIQSNKAKIVTKVSNGWTFCFTCSVT